MSRTATPRIATARPFVLALAAAAAVAWGTPAVAQDRSGSDGDRFHDAHDGGQQGRYDRSPGDNDRGGDRRWRDDWRSEGGGRSGMMSGMMDDHRGTGRGGRDGRGDWDPHEGMASGQRGATFALRAGDVRLLIRCAPSEPVRACVDAATTLLDKARAAGGASTSPTPPAETPRP